MGRPPRRRLPPRPAAPAVAEAPPAPPAPTAAPPAPPRPATGAPPALQVRLRETDDEAADRARLQEVLRLVREAPGDQPAYLTIAGLGETVTLALPDCATSHALVESLRQALGEFGAAEIEAAPVAVAGA